MISFTTDSTMIIRFLCFGCFLVGDSLTPFFLFLSALVVFFPWLVWIRRNMNIRSSCCRPKWSTSHRDKSFFIVLSPHSYPEPLTYKLFRRKLLLQHHSICMLTQDAADLKLHTSTSSSLQAYTVCTATQLYLIHAISASCHCTLIIFLFLGFRKFCHIRCTNT